MVGGCPLPRAVFGWSLTQLGLCHVLRNGHTCDSNSSASLCSVLNSFTSVPRAAVSLPSEPWWTSQVPAQAACKRNILKTVNDHAFTSTEGTAGSLCPETRVFQRRSVQTDLLRAMVCWSAFHLGSQPVASLLWKCSCQHKLS